MIRIEAGFNGITRVFQNGNELRGIKEVRFTHNAMDNIPRLLIEFSDDKVEIDTAIVPELPDFYKPFYEKKPGAEAPSHSSN